MKLSLSAKPSNVLPFRRSTPKSEKRLRTAEPAELTADPKPVDVEDLDDSAEVADERDLMLRRGLTKTEQLEAERFGNEVVAEMRAALRRGVPIGQAWQVAWDIASAPTDDLGPEDVPVVGVPLKERGDGPESDRCRAGHSRPLDLPVSRSTNHGRERDPRSATDCAALAPVPRLESGDPGLGQDDPDRGPANDVVTDKTSEGASPASAGACAIRVELSVVAAGSADATLVSNLSEALSLRKAERGGTSVALDDCPVDPSERVVGERLAREEMFSASPGARILLDRQEGPAPVTAADHSSAALSSTAVDPSTKIDLDARILALLRDKGPMRPTSLRAALNVSPRAMKSAGIRLKYSGQVCAIGSAQETWWHLRSSPVLKSAPLPVADGPPRMPSSLRALEEEATELERRAKMLRATLAYWIGLSKERGEAR